MSKEYLSLPACKSLYDFTVLIWGKNKGNLPSNRLWYCTQEGGEPVVSHLSYMMPDRMIAPAFTVLEAMEILWHWGDSGLEVKLFKNRNKKWEAQADVGEMGGVLYSIGKSPTMAIEGIIKMLGIPRKK